MKYQGIHTCFWALWRVRKHSKMSYKKLIISASKMKFKNPLGAPENILLRGLHKKFEPIRPRGYGCRGGAIDFGPTTSYNSGTSVRFSFDLIILVKIDNNLANGGFVYPLHHAVSESRSFCVFWILKNVLLGKPRQLDIDIIPIYFKVYNVILLLQ